MKSPTTDFQTAMVETGTTPVWLLELNGNYYADRAISDGTNSYTAKVLEWSDISAINRRMSGGGILTNTALSLHTDAHADVRIGNAAKIYLWFENESLVASDRLLMFSGIVSDPISVTETQVTCTLKSIEESRNAVIGTLINSTDFPNADGRSLAKMAPVIYGDVQQVEALPVNVGVLTTLVTDITAAATSIEVSDTAGMASSGAIVIDDETISYSSISGNTLTVTRGGSATAHDKGADVVEDIANHDFLIADHSITSLDSVYADGVRVPSADYSLQTVSGRAYVRFADYPTIPQTVDVDVTATDVDTTVYSGAVSGDSVQVTDNIGLDFSEITKVDIHSISDFSQRDTSWGEDDTLTVNKYLLPSAVWGSVQVFDFTVSMTNNGSQYDSFHTTIYAKGGAVGDDWTLLEQVYWDLDPGQTGALGSYTITRSGSYIDDSLHVKLLRTDVPAVEDFTATISNVVRTDTYDVTVDISGSAKAKIGTTDVTNALSIKGGTSVAVAGTQTAKTLYPRKITVGCTGYNQHGPEDIVEHLLLNYGNGVVSGDLDTSLTADSEGFGSDYNLGFAITKQSDLMTLCRKIAFQSFSQFHWDGGLAKLSRYLAASNGITGGEFESWTSGVPDNWTYTGSSSDLSQDTGTTGSAVGITASTSQTLDQTVNTVSGDTYTLAFMYKSEDDLGGYELTTDAGTGVYYIGSTSDWAMKVVRFTAAGSTAAIKLFASIDSNKTTFDAVQVIHGAFYGVTPSDVVLNSMSFSWTSMKEIVNSIDAPYEKIGDDFGSIESDTDSASITQYGTKDGSNKFKLDLVQSSTTAGNVVSGYIELLDDPKRKVVFSCPASKVDYERGDGIIIHHSIEGGWYGKAFRCTETHLVVGSGKSKVPDGIRIIAEEI